MLVRFPFQDKLKETRGADSHNPFYSLTALQPCLGALNISALDPAKPTNREAFLGCIIDKVIPCLTKLPKIPVSGLGK